MVSHLVLWVGVHWVAAVAKLAADEKNVVRRMALVSSDGLQEKTGVKDARFGSSYIVSLEQSLCRVVGRLLFELLDLEPLIRSQQ